MARFFEDASFLRDMLVVVVASHLGVMAARRSGLGIATSALSSLVTALLALTALLYPETSYAGFPTRATFQAILDDCAAAWPVLNETSAPLPVLPGIVVAGCAILWCCVMLADWAAFRLRHRYSPALVVAPALEIFVATSLLGVDQNRVRHAALFSAAVALVWLTQRSVRQVREQVWIESKPGTGAGTTLRIGIMLTALALCVGVLAGPALPGAGAGALVDVTEFDTVSGGRVVVSPLVQVRAQLNQQPETVAFLVEAPRANADYWRLMSLDFFDGRVWRQSSNFRAATGLLSSEINPAVEMERLRQTFTIAALGNIYLPGAHEIREVIDDGGIPMEYEASTATLVVTRRGQNMDRTDRSYVIESALPRLGAAAVSDTRSSDIAAGLLTSNTQLPDDFPVTVATLAQEIVATAGSDYEKALALQNYFRDSNRFSYDRRVAASHNVNDLESFLSIGRGYCEQFASAFATMARSVGLATRVAVGFTWGDWNPDSEAFVVRGKHAHAWPEVYLAGAGWIRFEPTPGRGAPNDFAITGQVAAQHGFTGTGQSEAGVQAPGGTGSGDDADRSGFVRSRSSRASTAASAGSGDASEPSRVWIGYLIVAAVVLPAPLMVWLLKSCRRRLRRARVAENPAERIELAWTRALEALKLVEITFRPQESPLEFTSRIQSDLNGLGPIERLALSITRARYAPDVPAALAAEAETCAGAIAAICRRRCGRLRRLASDCDPRPLLGFDRLQ